MSGGPKTISKAVDGNSWDAWTSALLGLKGNGKFFQERITLHENGVESAAAFLDNQGMMLSESYQATFPGGAAYTLDTGFLSLYGKEDTISWSAASNGSKITFNRTLPDAYLAGWSPSISYGLHIGSAMHDVKGSLVVGGYDSSRCISDPIVSDGESVELTQMTLGVTYGGSAYTKSISPSTNLLKESGSSSSSLEVYPNPSVPYMYLPKETCDALAAYLPVTYNSDFNLYFWNTQSKAYQEIISSPHYIGFTFSANGKTSTISVPFALLNLTLESPLVSTPTPYFPCSPWTSTDVPYHLGRAFLQGAFLAQNWQTKKLFLAQAPGPNLDVLPPYIKKIVSSDTNISPATNPPIWEDTWSSTLKALPGKAPEDNSKSGLSGGAIAGIVVGVIVGIALVVGIVIWLVIRRRRRARQAQLSVSPETAQYGTYGNGEVYAYRKQQDTPPVYEVDSEGSTRAEMEGRQVSELDGEGHAK